MRVPGADTTTERTPERGQALPILLVAVVVLVFGAGALIAFGKALLERGRYQRSADLVAVSAARSMHDDFERLFEPPVLPDGTPNPHHLSRARYLLRARLAAQKAALANHVSLGLGDVTFPDFASFAPTRVRARLKGKILVRASPAQRRARQVPTKASAEAEIGVSAGAGGMPSVAEGGGYSGPLAYRQGKPMRPDVAVAFDRMAAAARKDGISLIIASAFRSDAEQAKLFAEHPDPRWVAPPGESLHRYATELDLGPPSAYGWLAGNAQRSHFIKRYSWEPWHYETPLATYGECVGLQNQRSWFAAGCCPSSSRTEVVKTEGSRRPRQSPRLIKQAFPGGALLGPPAGEEFSETLVRAPVAGLTRMTPPVPPKADTSVTKSESRNCRRPAGAGT